MNLDNDLRARQEARALARQAHQAQLLLGSFPQSKLDAIVEAIAAAFQREAASLAKMAVEETGFGNVPDKTFKNTFAAQAVSDAIRDMKTVGVLRKDPGGKLWEVGVPLGVIAAIVPSTNPTSTVCYKSLIALKSGNTIVFSPHPNALACTRRAAQFAAEAAHAAGAPDGAIACLSIPSLDGCKELMTAPETRLILATGGPAMVHAAYSSGKPAIGVGAGNGPAYIHPSANVKQALKDILRSKTFDNGTVCASEQSIITEASLADTVRQEARALGYCFLSGSQAQHLAQVLFRPNGTLNPQVVGKDATFLAKLAGFSVPDGTKILVAEETEVGPSHPFSREKLCPVLAFYVEKDEEAVLQTVKRILSHEGTGHTFTIHATRETVIQTFALQVPVSRFLVNTPAALGGIGATTPLFPALTLGCGAAGGSASSNNISPMDLINIRRIAFDSGEKAQDPTPIADTALIDALAEKILQRLGTQF